MADLMDTQVTELAYAAIAKAGGATDQQARVIVELSYAIVALDRGQWALGPSTDWIREALGGTPAATEYGTRGPIPRAGPGPERRANGGTMARAKATAPPVGFEHPVGIAYRNSGGTFTRAVMIDGDGVHGSTVVPDSVIRRAYGGFRGTMRAGGSEWSIYETYPSDEVLRDRVNRRKGGAS